MTKSGTEHWLKSARMAPMVNAMAEGIACKAVSLLQKGGFNVSEITLTTPEGVSTKCDIASKRSPCVGVCTQLNAVQTDDAIKAGADFVALSASADGPVPLCQASFAQDGARPSNALRVMDTGPEFVKVIPVVPLGNAGFVKAQQSVFLNRQTMPTGGIGPDHVASYLKAGHCRRGDGGSMVSKTALFQARIARSMMSRTPFISDWTACHDT